jgi:RNA polymerase sigma-70 factor, ECF subfamily
MRDCAEADVVRVIKAATMIRGCRILPIPDWRLVVDALPTIGESNRIDGVDSHDSSCFDSMRLDQVPSNGELLVEGKRQFCPTRSSDSTWSWGRFATDQSDRAVVGVARMTHSSASMALLAIRVDSTVASLSGCIHLPATMTATPDMRGSGASPVVSAAREDLALLERVASGDERALGSLYDRHASAAFALAKAIVKSHADAEDVVAAAFAQIWRSAATYDRARGSVGGWVCTITRTRALDLLRSRKRRDRVTEEASRGDDEGLALPLASAPVQPDVDAERDETRRMVARSLEALPEPQRRVIELAYFGGLSQSEIAERLSEPLGTVKTRMRSAMEKLRVTLGPQVRGQEERR